MAWIELHQSLPTHRKTLAAADILNMEPVHFMGHIISFWLWALDNVPDGELDGISPRMIAIAAQWQGDPGDFLNALIEAGFIDETDDGLVIHDWHDYAGRLIDQRQNAAQQKRRHRELYNNKALIQAIRERDKNRCRYCGRAVNWKDRKSPEGATYDYVDPNGPTSLDNVVVACRACNAGKGQRTPEEAKYTLLPPPTENLQISNQNQVDIKSEIKPESSITVPYSTVQYSTNNKEYICAPDGARAYTAPSPGGSVEAEKVTATLEDKPSKSGPRSPFKSKRQEQLFDEFWERYPKKRSKGRAERAWVKIKPDEQLFKAILDGLERAKTSVEWLKDDGQYIPYPSSWLNAKGWEDEYTATEVNANAKHQRYTSGPSAFGNTKPQSNRFAGLVRDGGTGRIAGQEDSPNAGGDSQASGNPRESAGDNESHKVAAGVSMA